MKKLKNIFYKLKGLWPFIPLFLEYLSASFRQMFKVLPPNDREIFFTLDSDRLYRNDDGNGRYAYLTLNLFSEAGYNVYLYKNIDFKMYYKLNRYGRYIYSIKNLKITSRVPERTKDMSYVFDDVHRNLLSRPWKRLTFINVLKPVFCRFGKMIWIPYFFHANMYRHGQHREIGQNRNLDKKLRIFFGGNTIRYYDNPALRQYGQLTRNEEIKAVLEIGEKAKFTQNIGEFCDFMENGAAYANECRMVGTDNTFPIHPTRWLKIIAKCDFFLCFSGTDLPMCHNVIEAMALGVIPIISYEDWFFPQLEHKKNAILFSGKEDLKAKVQEVLAMNQAEIESMRRNVIEYYENHLSIDSFIRKYENSGNELNTIMLHPRLICTPAEDEHARRLMSELEVPLRNK